MVYIIVTPLLYWIIRYKYGAWISLALIFLLLFFFNLQFLNYWIFYVLGACVGIHYKRFARMKYPLLFIVFAFCYLFVSTSVGMFFDNKPIPVYTLIRLSQVSVIWICADLAANPKEPKWWMILSVFIYLSHSMILGSLERIIVLLFGRTTLGAVVGLVVAPAPAFLIIIILGYLLKKIKPLWFVLTGGRG